MKITHRKVNASRVDSDIVMKYWYSANSKFDPAALPEGVNITNSASGLGKLFVQLDRLMSDDEARELGLEMDCPPESILEGYEEENPVTKYYLLGGPKDNYIQGSEDIDAASIAYRGNYKVISDSNNGGYYITDRNNNVVKLGFATESSANDYIDSQLTASTNISNSSSKQIFASEDTSIPQVYKLAKIPYHAVVLGYAWGMSDDQRNSIAQVYSDSYDAEVLFIDPASLSSDHNREVASALRQDRGADVAICSDVFDVIKEARDRSLFLSSLKSLIVPSGQIILSFPEDEFDDIRELVNSMFKHTIVEDDDMIIVRNKLESDPSDEDEPSITEAELVNKLETAIGKWYEENGLDSDEWLRDYTVIDVSVDDENRACAEVRAELDYDSMIELAAELDNIVSELDPDAYFDMAEPGVMDCFFEAGIVTDINSAIDIDDEDESEEEGYQDIRGYMTDEEIEREIEDQYSFNYPHFEHDPADDYPRQEEIEIPFDIVIEVDDDQDCLIENEEAFFDDALVDFDYEESGISENDIIEEFYFVIGDYIPFGPGNFRLKGKAKLVFDVEYDDELERPWGTANNKLSTAKIDAVDPVADSVTSSTSIDSTVTRVTDNDDDVDEEVDDEWEVPTVAACDVDPGDTLQLLDGRIVTVDRETEPEDDYDIAFIMIEYGYEDEPFIMNYKETDPVGTIYSNPF